MTNVLVLLVGLALGALGGWVVVVRERSRGGDGVISERFGAMRDDLDRVAGLVQQMETNRATSHGRLEQHLVHTTETTRALADTTEALKTALASPSTRGAWGERMAADVLRHAGMIEGVNYLVHQTLDSGSRPDFTFPLPGDRMLHMDVKFPLDNHLRSLEAEEHGDTDVAERFRKAFLRDVRARITEITSRQYVDVPAGTLDYVLLFLPNEQVYGHVHQHDPALLDHAMRNNVILCSPLTLLAVLAVVRETVDNFALEQASQEVLGLLTGFRDQWDKFVREMERLGQRMDTARKTYDDLLGVRARGIEKQLDRIDQVRSRALRADDVNPAERPAPDTVTSAYYRDRGDAA